MSITRCEKHNWTLSSREFWNAPSYDCPHCRMEKKMSHHIDKNGDFQFDKNKDLPPNKITLSFKDPIAQQVLLKYAKATPDRELGDDMLEVLKNKFGVK